MLKKIQPVLLALLPILEMAKEAIIAQNAAKAEALVGKEVFILYSNQGDSAMYNGIISSLVAQEGQFGIVLVDTETKEDKAFLPLFDCLEIDEASTPSTSPIRDVKPHPLVGKRVQVTTSFRTYQGTLSDIGYNSLELDMDGGKIEYLTVQEYSICEI